MAQVDVYQYVEVIKSDGTKLRLGSKQKPSTITLTGTGQVLYRIYNDITATTVTTLYAGELTEPLKWFGVKSSVAGKLAYGEDATSSSVVHLSADIWQFYTLGEVTADAATLALRAAESAQDINSIKFYHPTGTADIEFVAAY